MTMKLKLINVLFYTFCILHRLGNISTVDDRFPGVTSKSTVDEEGGGNLRVGRSSSTNIKLKMARTKTNKSTNAFIRDPKFFEWVEQIYNTTEGNLDIIIEDKKREDAYKRMAAKNSPHSVFLLVLFDEVGLCTGSLITTTWVLTAGHCVFMDNKTAKKIILYAGGNSFEEILNNRPPKGSQLQVSTEFYIHPNYKTKDDYSYDVAVIRSPRRFDLTKTVKKISLSKRPWRFKGYKECVFTGFGTVNMNETHADDNTRKTQQLKIESPCHCAADIDLIVRAGTYLCTEPMEDYGLCTGDSGGGLVCDGQIMGTAMFVLGMTNAETCEIDKRGGDETKCGDKNTITVFQDSYVVRNWIQSTLKTPRKENNGHGCHIRLSTGLLTLSMVINIL